MQHQQPITATHTIHANSGPPLFGHTTAFKGHYQRRHWFPTEATSKIFISQRRRLLHLIKFFCFQLPFCRFGLQELILSQFCFVIHFSVLSPNIIYPLPLPTHTHTHMHRAAVTQLVSVNFAFEGKCLPCSKMWSQAPDKDLKPSAGKWGLSVTYLLGATLNQISQSNVNFKQHFIKKAKKIISSKDSVPFLTNLIKLRLFALITFND